MENMSNTDVAVSLHLYCPPFDACSVFNKATGKKTKAQVRFIAISVKGLINQSNNFFSFN